MRVFAHRGHHLDVPENTLKAFQRAARLGVDGIESDLRLSADGRIVLFHDRLINSRDTESLSHAELCAAAGYAVPTLADALAALPDVEWLLELKTERVAMAVRELLQSWLHRVKLTVISFHHQAVVSGAEHIETDWGLSLGETPLGFLDAAGQARQANSRINTLVWNHEFLDPSVFAQARAAGWRCLVFNVTTREDHETCRQRGATGIITDYPEYVLGRDGDE